MKILHLCLNGPYTDNWGYQENILPKYHRLAGYDVVVVATNKMHVPSGEIVDTDAGSYFTPEGVKIIRLAPQKLRSKKFTKLFQPYQVYPVLKSEMPDLIMVHGLMGSVSILDVHKYVHNVNRGCSVVADLHEGYFNSSGKCTSLKSALIGAYYKIVNRVMYPLYKKVFCITPNCIDYAKGYYHVPSKLLELLPLGYDPALFDTEKAPSVRAEIREKYNIVNDDILIVHGGKIIPRRKTAELIDAVSRLDDPRVKLIIFGGMSDELKVPVESRISKHKAWLRYAGHLEQTEYYKLYQASDIAAFPGGQSVLWQEAISLGLPLLISRQPGVDYLDLGGNLEIVSSNTVESIYQGLQNMLRDDRYKEMANIAKENGKAFFSYERIARQVIESASKQGKNNT